MFSHPINRKSTFSSMIKNFTCNNSFLFFINNQTLKNITQESVLSLRLDETRVQVHNVFQIKNWHLIPKL